MIYFYVWKTILARSVPTASSLSMFYTFLPPLSLSFFYLSFRPPPHTHVQRTNMSFSVQTICHNTNNHVVCPQQGVTGTSSLSSLTFIHLAHLTHLSLSFLLPLISLASHFTSFTSCLLLSVPLFLSPSCTNC